MENKLFSKTFLWMAIGLAVTFATGFVVASNPRMLAKVFSTWGYWLFVILEFGLVIFLSARVMRMKPTTAKISFILYSFVSGLTFSSIFVYYSLSSIMYVFLISALIFALMSYLGYATKIDLTKVGTYLYIGLLAVLVTMLINFFIGSSTLTMIISIICVVIFIGITAYDVQKIKQLEDAGLPEENLAIYGALDLYLDFINLFIHIISIFGNSNDN